MRFLKKLLGILPLSYASAHCDVPCGIYDPRAMQVAAQTVLKMVQKMNELEKSGEDKTSMLEYKNSLTRMIVTKEAHAQKCKEELLILWTDYFKSEHLVKCPDLHEVIWKAAKLCSQNKQHLDEKKAQELIDATNHIAEIFKETQASS